ncbi:MAG TPA: SO2930 family diheme c-type cytochrome, partial [Pirellulales bacterium]|nr:SO2930 family diheme c-type cytochrome [Pirellulales bacterium]
RTLPDMVLDWSQDPAHEVNGSLPDDLRIVFSDNGDADFARIDLAARVPSPNKISQDLAAFVGTRAPLTEVRLDPPRAEKEARPRRHIPRRLSEYGFFSGDVARQQPAAGVVPYDVNTPLFSDYTAKHRFVKLPPGMAAIYSADDVFEMPVGTQIVKTFAMPRDLRRPETAERLLETRVLERTTEGWSGVTYVWDDDQKEATLALAGGTIDVEWLHTDGKPRRNNYLVPNVNQCKGCHGTSAGMTPIGIRARHLNRSFDYGEAVEDQLAHWASSGLLSGAPDPSVAPRTPVWDDEKSGIDERARAWLEINCAHCHQPGGNAQNSGLDLRLSQHDPTKWGVLKPPVAAGTGSGGMQYDVVPGKPEQSILFLRLRSTHPDVMMPELGKRLVPEEAVGLIEEWIKQMK